MTTELTGKVALVTGARGGLGLALVEGLVQAGCVTAAVDLRPAEPTMPRSGERAHGRVVPFTADVSDETSIGELVADLESEFGRIDILINNAGVTKFEGEGDLLSLPDWRLVIDVNLNGVWNCSRHVLPGMLRNQNGCILNIGSVASTIFTGSSIGYVVSKGAVDSLTRALARRVWPHVRVNAVSPGSMNTDWYARYYPPEGGARPQRFVPVTDVVRACLDLIANPSITGQVVVVDGGEGFLK